MGYQEEPWQDQYDEMLLMDSQELHPGAGVGTSHSCSLHLHV